MFLESIVCILVDQTNLQTLQLHMGSRRQSLHTQRWFLDSIARNQFGQIVIQIHLEDIVGRMSILTSWSSSQA